MCAPRLGRGGGGQGGCGRLGASGPGARRGDGCHGDGQAPAPRARTRIVSAGRQLLGPERRSRRTFWKRGLAWVWAGFNLGDCSRLLAPRRGAREEPRVPGPGFPWFESGLLTPLNPVARPSLLVAELVGEKQQESSRERRRTGARAQEEALPLRRVSRPAWLILQIGGKRGHEVELRDRLGRSRRG